MAVFNPVAHDFPGAISSDCCESLIYLFPLGGNLKCAKSFKYLMSNRLNSEFWGMEESQILGLTFEDLSAIEGHKVLGYEHRQSLQLLDQAVIDSKKTQVLSAFDVITRSGLIARHDVIKVPIIDKNNHVASILSLNYDLTKTINLLELLELYTGKYGSKKIAVSYILKHLDLVGFFAQEPSHSEMRVLLSIFYHGDDRCYVASRLNKSFKTIQKHVDSLKDKLHPAKNFKGMISSLRLVV